MKRLLVILVFLLQGCVGGMVLHDRHTTSLYDERSTTPRSSPFGLSDALDCNGLHRPISKESVLATCGKPSEVQIINGHERWRYKGGLGWSGVVIFVILPVPILVPTGYRDTVLEFYQGRLTSLEWSRTEESAAFCGFIFLHVTQFGCYSD